MKKIIGLMCLLMTLAGSAFAKNAEKKGIGFYGKGNIGYANIIWHENGVSESTHNFEIAPVFGITGLVPLPHFALEAFCNMDFGGKKELIFDMQSIVFAPGTRAVWAPPISFFSKKTGTWQDQLIPYVGAGFSVPIASYKYDINFFGKTTKEDTKVYFDVEFQLGCRWAFNEKIAVLTEYNIAFGGIFKDSFTAGAIYTFK